VTSNSTIECYKTFMFGQGCTKIKTLTSSMVINLMISRILWSSSYHLLFH
jgi:hypothetical protein